MLLDLKCLSPSLSSLSVVFSPPSFVDCVCVLSYFSSSFFSWFSFTFASLNLLDLVLELGAILSQSSYESLINMLLGIRYPSALSVNRLFASSFNSDRMSFSISLNHEGLIFQMLGLYLFDLF